MFMRREIRKDDRGIALISVMICVMLCFLLSATIMRISLLSYLQKGIGRQSTATFYENEAFVDDIKLGVQQKVAEAFAATATSTVMDQSTFVANFISGLRADGYDADSASSDTDKEIIERALRSYIVNANPTKKLVSLTVEGDGTNYIFEETNGEIVIKNIRIEYTDNSKGGYISKIKTDIRIRSPYYTTTTTDVTTGGSYSMMAANGAFIANSNGEGRNNWGNLKQGGDVYIGYEKGTVSTELKEGSTTEYQVKSAKALSLDMYMSYWMTGKNVLINGDVYIKNHSTFIFTGSSLVVRGKVIIDDKNSHLVLGKDSKITCKDIVVAGKSVDKEEYKFDGTGDISDLPVDRSDDDMQKNQASSVRTKWNGVASSIAVYNGSHTTDMSSKSSKIVIDKTIHPVSNVDADRNAITDKDKLEASGGDQYDYEMASLLDVPVLNNAEFGNKTQKFFAASYDEVKDADGKKTGKWKNITKGAINTNEWHTFQGKTIGLNIGGDVQTINNNYGYFMIKWDDSDMGFGPLNTGGSTHPEGIIFFGVFLSKGQIKMSLSGPLSVAQSLDEYYGSVDTAKLVLAEIGKGVIIENDGETYHWEPNPANCGMRTLSFDDNTINNFFRRGIQSMYSSEDSENTTVTTYTNDEQKNRTLDVVTFENWEKY